MNPFFIYLLKSSAFLVVFYVFYKAVMSHERFFQLNRFLLLGILVASTFLPFLNLNFIETSSPISQPIEVIREFVSAPVKPITDAQLTEPVEMGKAPLQINPWMVLYIFIISSLFIKLVISFSRVYQIIHQAQKITYKGFVLAVVKDFIQPFSFLKKVVLSEKDYHSNREEIITHEIAHINNYHFIDLVICEVFTMLYWFNPFMWLLKRDLKLIHEFQADQAVLNKGINANKYQLLVLKKAVGERRFAMANNFTQCPISKRIKMMKKQNKKPWAPIKLLLFVPLGIVLLQAFSSPELVSKVGSIAPILSQQDSSQLWLDAWVNKRVEILQNPSSEEFAKINTIKVEDIVEEGSREFYLDDTRFNKRNILVVLQNKEGKILCEGELAAPFELTKHLKSIFNGKHPYGEKLPNAAVLNLPLAGEVHVPNLIVSYVHDIGTPKGKIGEAMRAIGKAYLELRDEKAKKFFGSPFFSLNGQQKQEIEQIVPIRVSFAVPKLVGRKSSKNVPPPPPPRAIKAKEVVPPPPPKAVHTLSIYLKNDGEGIDVEKIRKDAEKHLQNPNVDKVKVIVVPEVGVSKEHVGLAIKELEKAGLQNVMVIAPSPPPPPKKIKDKTHAGGEAMTLPKPLDVRVKKGGEIYLFGEKTSPDELEKKAKGYVGDINNFNGATENKQVASATVFFEEGVTDVEYRNVLYFLKACEKISVNTVAKKTVVAKVHKKAPATISISLLNDGVIYVGKNKYTSFKQFGEKMGELREYWDEVQVKDGLKLETTANVLIGIGVTDSEVRKLKNILTSTKIQHINYSTDKKKI